jgi:hypothetical protein
LDFCDTDAGSFDREFLVSALGGISDECMRSGINFLLARQAELNNETESNWSLYRAHRERVTQLTLSAISHHPYARVCILGAGNCNDLALTEVEQRAAEIWLVDIDEAALERGLARHRMLRQPQAPKSARLVTKVGIDLTGLAATFLESPETSMPTALERAMTGPILDIASPFDVVVSAGLLTQLLSLPIEALGKAHPQLTPLVLAVRTGHIRLMARLLRPGGHGILVTEVVSSDTAPALKNATEAELPQLLADTIATHNFFTGMSPAGLVKVMRTDPWLAAAITEPSSSGPWRWQIAPSRAYLVIALMFRRLREPLRDGFM